MILRIVAVGRIGRGPEAELFVRYAARLRPRPIVIEIGDGRGGSAEIARRESAGLLGAIPETSLAVALDSGGDALDSAALAVRMTQWQASGRDLAFIIGGAEGLDASVLARADTVLSLGPLTWPHLLARVMLAEQLFRAQSIAAGHPYHRTRRPQGS